MDNLQNELSVNAFHNLIWMFNEIIKFWYEYIIFIISFMLDNTLFVLIFLFMFYLNTIIQPFTFTWSLVNNLSWWDIKPLIKKINEFDEVLDDTKKIINYTNEINNIRKKYKKPFYKTLFNIKK
jgi:hypothetical protein